MILSPLLPSAVYDCVGQENIGSLRLTGLVAENLSLCSAIWRRELPVLTLVEEEEDMQKCYRELLEERKKLNTIGVLPRMNQYKIQRDILYLYMHSFLQSQVF